ncbi:hypothetical protein H0H81_003183 [Sphagnurus paluster]|uniref:N-acetylglucosaminylphosphatidylinositol deacetylase n=1 Tax=Sphagnurus paluster TaxID=117069 RepID=A0A9P7FV94_9AGAR|nr:hypothetical protein H0H81_003183 [Sphagnurus paluster]
MSSTIVVLLALLIALLVQPQHSNEEVFSKGNVLLLTAHPDDECMFFAPTIRALTRSNISLFSLCLSVGDAEGLGAIRREELSKSLDVLAIPLTRRWAIDHPDLQDNFTAQWDAGVISNVVEPYVSANNISIILTFDVGGVSGHPNHRSLPAGAHRLLEKNPDTFKLYTLITRPVVAKYTSLVAPLYAKFTFMQHQIFPVLNTRLAQRLGVIQLSAKNSKPPPTLVSGIADYVTALSAMRAHASQLVWFRYLYVLFSRYMWVNEWDHSP